MGGGRRRIHGPLLAKRAGGGGALRCPAGQAGLAAPITDDARPVHDAMLGYGTRFAAAGDPVGLLAIDLFSSLYRYALGECPPAERTLVAGRRAGLMKIRPAPGCLVSILGAPTFQVSPPCFSAFFIRKRGRQTVGVRPATHRPDHLIRHRVDMALGRKNRV